MVFGILIDVPLLVITFALLYAYRRGIAGHVSRLSAPPILLSLLTAIPLVIFEEQINCEATWCGRVVIPPTVPFILIEIVVLGLLAVYLRARSLGRVIVAFCIFGVFWEYLLGGLRGLEPSLEAVFLVPYVALSYAFVSLLPISVLMEASARQPKRDVGGGGPGSQTLSRSGVERIHGSSMGKL